MIKVSRKINNNLIALISFVIIFVSLVLIVLFRDVVQDWTIKSTDLDKENIGGLHLGQNYSLELMKKTFGDTNRVFKEGEKIKCIQFWGIANIAQIDVDTSNNVIESIYIEGDNGIINTSRGINTKSYFNEIVREYGINYSKRSWKNFMGSGDGFSITYIDKNNRCKLQFSFSNIAQMDKGHFELQDMILFKY